MWRLSRTITAKPQIHEQQQSSIAVDTPDIDNMMWHIETVDRDQIKPAVEMGKARSSLEEIFGRCGDAVLLAPAQRMECLLRRCPAFDLDEY